MLDEALSYLRRGWSVVPGHVAGRDGLCSCNNMECESPGKHPRIKWLEFQQRLPSEREVAYWWGKRWPDANIAVVTGTVSHLVAVDVDPRHGGDDAWAAWAKTHIIPATPISQTGGGGQHYLFLHPGVEVRNRTNMLSPGHFTASDGRRVPLESGVDFRGDGGYIVLPPSRHTSGREYAWDVDAHPDDVPLAAMPQSLVDLVLNNGTAGVRKVDLDVDGYVSGKAQIPEGARNETMARLAGYFARSVDDEGTLRGVLASLNSACCDPPLPDSELNRITQSIWGREQTQRKARVVAEAAVDSADLSAAPPIDVAGAVWRSLGVPVVTDWFLLVGAVRSEYVLVTPEDEMHIPDILDYDRLRTELLKHTGALPPIIKRGAFDDRARLLRATAREVAVGERHVEDMVAEWVQAYITKVGAREVPEEQRNDALQSGPVFFDGEVHLRVHRLAQFIEATYGDRIEPRDLRALLRQSGWEQYLALRSMRKAWGE